MSQDPTSRDTFTKNEKNGKLTATQSEHGEKNVDETQFKKLQPGYLLGEHKEFRLVKMLGKGGMGVTWLAEELDSSGKKKQAVVCKILSKELIGNSKAVQNVLEVFDLTKELNHTNICPLLNRFQDPVFKDFLVMRYAEGETLEEWFKKQSGHENGLPAQTVLPVLQQIAAALDAMHLRKIIHRDVKPQNIMFNARNTTFSVPWLIDFGIAQAVNTSDPAQNRRKSGTPIFMAPEQHYGKPQDARTDQYALAVTAFWLLTGHFPFDADTAEELSGKKMFPQNSLTPVSESLKSTFLRALAYEPKDRFESCGEFVNALSAVSTSVPSFSSKGTAGQTAETQVPDVDTMAEEIYRKMQQEQQEEAERQKERNDQLAKEKAKRAAARLLARQQKKQQREEKRRQKAALKAQKKAERLARARLRKEQNGGRPPLFNRRNFLLGGLGATAAALGVWWVADERFWFQYKREGDSLILVKYTGFATNVTIPHGVTSIGERAFHECKSLTSVTIPDSVTSIGDSAFSWCESLTSVTIPNSVTSIGNSAFFSCTSLTSVTIPNSVTSIGDSAFCGCDSLTSVTIPESVTSIGDHAFCACYSLTSVTIPNSVPSIGDYAFSNCYRLTSVTIPDSVTSIGGHAFSGCESLTSVTIPDSVTSIGDHAFRDCESLTSVTIPDSVTSIGGWAFLGCERLTSVTIPDSVTSIKWDAFSGCTSLKSVTIPDSVTIIENEAFSGCTSLTSVTIPDSVTSIGNEAFRWCKSLKSVTIPNSVTYIGDYAFYECSSLTSVTIPDSVTSIGDHAFDECESLTSVTIPDSVTSIGNYAFIFCRRLTSVRIPDSVTSIGKSAFLYCHDDLVIYGKAGSKAERFAKEHGMKFEVK